MDNSDRRKEILNVCLDTFINKGLSETTVRDLSTALKLQSGGIYYWFKDKDEAVVACAEEAALRLEDFLIFPALKDIKDPDKMMKRLKIRADEMQPTMKFFASVYRDGVVKVDIGASLGVGASVALEVDVGGMVDTITDTATAAWEGVKSGWKAFTSWF